MPGLSFASDYMEGAHPAILKRLAETNLLQSAGYGTDEFSEAAREKVRAACKAPEADVYFLVGGTQANATVIDALLKSYQGVLAAESAHINVHEAGAIEHGGHRVTALPHTDGKLSADTVRAALKAYDEDETREHTVMPGMVYISQPTETGMLYSLDELTAISGVCREYGIPLYADGARLAYALACPENDVTLADLARLCDVFYIGGTKCGALFGEAVVIPQHGFIPHFFSIIKQHGALLAKGRIAALQFDALFTDGLYDSIGRNAIEAAGRIRAALKEYGYHEAYPSPTNQIFVLLDKEKARRIAEAVDLSFTESVDDARCVIRFVTSWATTDENVNRLIEVLKKA